MLRTYAVCDHCEDAEILYDKVKDVGFEYEHIVDEGEPQFEEVEGWVVKGVQDPDDPITIEFKFYCPKCAALDAVDSGLR